MNVLDYIIYEPLPDYYYQAYNHNKALGWVSTKLTPDEYDITKIRPGHCPLKHMKLKDYIVGNFLIYNPISYFEEFKSHINVKRLIYSDRLFTRLVECGWLHLHPVSVAAEIPHFSHVLGKWRD